MHYFMDYLMNYGIDFITYTSILIGIVNFILILSKKYKKKIVGHFVLLDKTVKTPSRGTCGSLAFDIYSPQNYTFEPHSVNKIETKIMFDFAKNYHGMVVSRSSHASNGLTIEGGIIDNDYTGEIKLIIYNHNSTPYYIQKNRAIAQLIFFKSNYKQTVKKVDYIVDKKTRGNRGFGSTNSNLLQ